MPLKLLTNTPLLHYSVAPILHCSNLYRGVGDAEASSFAFSAFQTGPFLAKTGASVVGCATSLAANLKTGRIGLPLESFSYWTPSFSISSHALKSPPGHAPIRTSIG